MVYVLDIQQEKQQSQNSKKKRLEGPSIVFESRISELEAQLTQTKMDLRKALEEADLYKKKLADQPLNFEMHSPLSAGDCDSHQQQIANLQRLVERKIYPPCMLCVSPICSLI
jgi:serologically defined colon cancer antigen 8